MEHSTTYRLRFRIWDEKSNHFKEPCLSICFLVMNILQHTVYDLKRYTITPSSYTLWLLHLYNFSGRSSYRQTLLSLTFRHPLSSLLRRLVSFIPLVLSTEEDHNAYQSDSPYMVHDVPYDYFFDPLFLPLLLSPGYTQMSSLFGNFLKLFP